MIITLEIPASTRRTIQQHKKLSREAPKALSKGLQAAVATGAEQIRESLVRGRLGLTMQHPASGLAASMDGWMVAPLTGAIGVPANSPAAAYARILETGGTIYPRTAKALAVPVSEEAKQYTSPRDMPGLIFIDRKKQGKPPLLVREAGGDAIEVMWVLLPSVTIPAFHWLTQGANLAKGPMAEAMQDVMSDYARKW